MHTYYTIMFFHIFEMWFYYDELDPARNSDIL